MKYDPERAPSPQEWLDLDEQERISMVEEHHRRRRIRLPSPTLHGTFHAVVENQLAMGEPVVARVLARLQNEGLNRHEAIHAIGSVLAGQIHTSLKKRKEGADPNESYFAALEELTAKKWLAG